MTELGLFNEVKSVGNLSVARFGKNLPGLYAGNKKPTSLDEGQVDENKHLTTREKWLQTCSSKVIKCQI